jgi:TadE-like protein
MRATSPRFSIRPTDCLLIDCLLIDGLRASGLAWLAAEAGRLKEATASGKSHRGGVAPLSQEAQPQSARARSMGSNSISSESIPSESILCRPISFQSIPSTSTRSQSGQATVEFALVLVALVGAVWALLSLCLVVRDQVLVTHASREAARTYAVTRSIDAATQAARDRSGLGENLLVTVVPQADNLARLTVSLNISSRVPLVGRVRPGLQLQSSLITYVEPA